MKTWSDSIVTLAAHLGEHLGPVTTVIDGIVDRLVGKHEAQACGGTFCYNFCSANLCGGNYVSIKYSYYSTSQTGCNYAYYICVDSSCSCYGG
jgi:hypothetical protein